MAERIVTSTEREKRDLVAAIAERGRAGYKAKEQTVQPNVDLAAAAAATVAADPVDLNAAQTEALGATAGAPAASAGRYAEAQRAIFEQGRGREQEYMGQRYGEGHDTQVEATNVDLGKYEAALQEAAARAAAVGVYPPTPSDDPQQEIGAYDPVRLNEIPYRIPAKMPEGLPDWYYPAHDEMTDLYARGFSFGGATGQMFTYLRNTGMSDDEARAALAEIEAVWAPQWNEDTREVVGGSQLLAPDGGLYGALGPKPAPVTAEDARRDNWRKRYGG